MVRIMTSYSNNFNKALDVVLKHEGGYVNHPQDPGGETNFGVTVAVARAYGYKGSMKSIPMDIVRRIYWDKYWIAGRCDALSYPVALCFFDACVNHGVNGAAKIMQRAVGVKPDGIIGPVTRAAMQNAKQDKLLGHFMAERIQYYTDLVKFSVFGKGWMRRMSGILHECFD